MNTRNSLKHIQVVECHTCNCNNLKINVLSSGQFNNVFKKINCIPYSPASF